MTLDAPIPCCLASVPPSSARHATLPLPAANDAEGTRLAEDLPPLVDAHVHVFPDKVFDAVWRWFDNYGWPVRYQLYADDVVNFLRARGVAHQVLLHYAHKPGIARGMNQFVADLVARHRDVTGLATVFPGEPDATDILADAFARGLRGVKLHTHVQGISADDPRMFDVYELCQAKGLPVVIHAGKEPKSEHLPVDPYAICAAERVDRVLTRYPRLKLCVPHLGASEFAAYVDLLRKHELLWLDTTMMLSSYFALFDLDGLTGDDTLVQAMQERPDRVMFGTDFPNLPYAWDREARAVAGFAAQQRLRDGDLERLCGTNARALFAIDERC